MTKDGITPLRDPNFRRYIVGRFFATVAVQMQTVAVGWQVYALSGDPLDLGLIGLSQFLPFLALVLVAGQVADMYDRVRVQTVCYALQAICALFLLSFTWSGLRVVWP